MKYLGVHWNPVVMDVSIVSVLNAAKSDILVSLTIRLDSICLMSLVVARELTAVAIWRALRIILTK